MDEFTSFNLKKVPDLKKDVNPEEPPFESDLGPFNWHQDRMIRFGQSKYMTIFVVILFISFLLSASSLLNLIFVTSVEGTTGLPENLFWAKAIAFISLFIFSLPFIGFFMVYINSHKVNTKGILSGLDVLHIFIVILYILFAVLSTLLLVVFFLLLFRAFIFVVLFGAIIGGLLYFYLSIIREMQLFNESIQSLFYHSTYANYKTPDAEKLINLLKGVIALALIGYVINLFDIEQVPSIIGPFSPFVDTIAFSIISMIVNLSSYIGLVVLLSKLQDQFKGGYYHVEKQKAKPVHHYDGYEDMFN